ncbi:hypothetical protein BD410DRAFT_780293 [Rickenella mellea]|uniref:Zn(2)-C6 fungal-type domain-containing protein n=1 Tax=Rickenella mellea TaxID=50990 RepID=A0A4R5XFA6_9AGAM|nr:hypothetical protein BD410DRAFT_780293 [Rickenella mellea]
MPTQEEESQLPPRLSAIPPRSNKDSRRTSPTGHNQERPPAKRSRKAINCEPCRASKLKCDRARPCSSCVLRGTASSCYLDGRDDPRDDPRTNRIDPHHEIARMRQSLATLEAHLLRAGPPQAVTTHAVPTSRAGSPPPPIAKQEPESDTIPDTSNPPGMLQRPAGGFYIGPTSAKSHFLNFSDKSDSRDSDDAQDRNSSDDQRSDFSQSDMQRGYDDDLLAHLPALHIIDGLVDYYFEYCNWIYRHVNHQAFSTAWGRFKAGTSNDRLTLATVCVIMAVAIRYLPERHGLLASLPHTHEELSDRYYSLGREAQTRHQAESRIQTLDLIELMLIRTHYLTFSKNESEEIWTIRGQLVSDGTAMGLHRDPEKWHMPRDLAERRRWAWWHIILLERWQCFLFGRPLSIASHHFDTIMPSYVDPNIDPTGRLWMPNLHLFRLAHILGDIVDDAVSARPVPHERVFDRDRQLIKWLDTLPKELDLDDYRLARTLSSPIPAVMRLGVQSVIIRTSYYHIRFTLHRPYAAAAHSHGGPSTGKSGSNSADMDERMAQSLDIAVNAADKLIQLVGQARPDFLANSSLAAPGHVHWGPFHCFSAAMFFSFQLISNPDQPGANLFRANIRRVLDILALQRGVPIADKATDVLLALAPLYDPQPTVNENEGALEREKKKRSVLSMVKTLAFPYDSPTRPHTHANHESPGGGRRSISSPGTNSGGSPAHGISAVSTLVVPSQQTPAPHSYQQPVMQDPHSPVRVSAQPQSVGYVSSSMHTLSPTNTVPSHPPPTTLHPSINPATNTNASSIYHGSSYSPHQSHQSQAVPPHPQQGAAYPPMQHSNAQGYETARVVSYPQTSEEDTIWGTFSGFGQGEWSRFLDVMQRPEPRPSH